MTIVMKTRTLVSAAVWMCATFLSFAAQADEKAVCLDAASKGQTLRDSHQLVEAREALRVCAREVCPAVVRSDCAGWLDAVEKVLPTVVLTAKDGAGADLVNVKVSVDGRLLVTSLDGRALPMNPGPHTFHFEAADGTSVYQQVLVPEGAQGRAVAVVLGAPPAAPVAPVTAAPALPVGGPMPSTPAVTEADEKTAGSGGGGLRKVGWIVGGVGVVGLGVGAVGGAMAMANKSSANCNSSNVCTNFGSVSSAKTAAYIADAGFIAGGVLLAGGVTLVLVGRPRGAETALTVTPLVGTTGGGMTVGGSW